MKSLISKKRLTEEERRRKQSLDSPQTIEANKYLSSVIICHVWEYSPSQLHL